MKEKKKKTADEFVCGQETFIKYFVNQMQFTKHALVSLGSTAFFNFSDGIFDGIKPPHVLSMGRKHIL